MILAMESLGVGVTGGKFCSNKESKALACIPFASSMFKVVDCISKVRDVVLELTECHITSVTQQSSVVTCLVAVIYTQTGMKLTADSAATLLLVDHLHVLFRFQVVPSL
jgi:hypothetical protein